MIKTCIYHICWNSSLHNKVPLFIGCLCELIIVSVIRLTFCVCIQVASVLFLVALVMTISALRMTSPHGMKMTDDINILCHFVWYICRVGTKVGWTICLASFFCLPNVKSQTWVPSLCSIGLDLDYICLACFFVHKIQACGAKYWL